MIYDCFIFHNELDLLEFRLKELYHVVDYFLIVEGNYTHKAKAKESSYLANADRFKPYQDKIIYKFMDLKYAVGAAYALTQHIQRDYIATALEWFGANDEDIIFVSDIDEIPDRNLVLKINQHGFDFPEEQPYYKDHTPEDVTAYRNGQSFCLLQDLYYYNLQCKCRDKWFRAKVARFGYLKEYKGGVSQFRIKFDKLDSCYHNAGWHFSYFGGPDAIRDKVESFVAHEVDTPEFKDEGFLNQRINYCRDPSDRITVDKTYIKKVEIDPSKLPLNYEMLL